MRGKKSSAVFAAVAVLVFGSAAHGVGRFRYEGPRAEALGVGEGLSVLLLDDEDRAGATHWWVQAGERDLFGIKDLGVSQLLAGVRRNRATVLLSTALLTAPVGREYHGAVEALWGRPSSLVLSARLGLWSLAVDGAAPAHLAGVGVGVCAPVATHVVAGYRVENVRVAGEPQRGADTSVLLVATPRPALALVAGLRTTRDGETGAWLASRMGWRRVEGLVGYDDTTAMLKASLVVRVAGGDIGIGVSTHPVLGISRSIAVRWAGQ